MKVSIIAAVFAAPLMILQPVWAHTNESLDAMQAPHGGKSARQAPIIWSLLRRRESWSYM